jgi:hypothetical protein
MNGHSTDEESKERRSREEQKENRGEENSISWIALHHRHLHLQLQQQVSYSLKKRAKGKSGYWVVHVIRLDWLDPAQPVRWG